MKKESTDHFSSSTRNALRSFVFVVFALQAPRPRALEAPTEQRINPEIETETARR
jgi:hypothetical protein